jgi:histidinol-phosphatase (PHP family)
MLFNLHTHTFFSDGSSHPEEYVKEALRQGFEILGFSDHSPVPFDNNFAIRQERLEEYIGTINKLKMEGRGIDILLGLEIDYIPGITVPTDHYRQNYPFDYFIGSVHLVKNGSSPDLWFIDGKEVSIYDNGLKRIFNGDIRNAVTAYYHQVNEMIITQKPEIIGHLDKIKMHNRNRYFTEDESWYVRLVDETTDIIKESGAIVEVNTRGIYKKRSDSLFPGTEILKKLKALNIPVTISTDAHKPAELSLGIADAKKTLMEIGFRVVSVITKKGIVEAAL